MVDIIESTYLVKFNSGSRGRAPVWVWGAKPQKLNVFFHFQKVIVALKWGRRPTSVEDFRGSDRGRPKGGVGSPPPPVSATASVRFNIPGILYV